MSQFASKAIVVYLYFAMKSIALILICLVSTLISENVKAATIFIEKGSLLYTRPIFNKKTGAFERYEPQSKEQFSKIENARGDWLLIAGSKGVKFRFVCKSSKSGSKTLAAGSEIYVIHRDICPKEPTGPLGESSSLEQNIPRQGENIPNIPNIPYIISPRYTLLRNPRPTFTWKAINSMYSGDASSTKTDYSVMLYKVFRGEESAVWNEPYCRKSSGKALEIFQYPAKERELQPQTTYKLVVKVVCSNSKCPSSEDEKLLPNYEKYRYSPDIRYKFPISELTFELVNTVTEKMILQKKEGEESGYTLGEIYRQRKVYYDAIDVTENDLRYGEGQQIPIAYSVLSKIYEDLGLDHFAVNSIYRGIRLAQIKNPKQVPDLKQEVDRLCSKKNKLILRSVCSEDRKLIDLESGFTKDCQSASSLPNTPHR
jgi:hypothetical protein